MAKQIAIWALLLVFIFMIIRSNSRPVSYIKENIYVWLFYVLATLFLVIVFFGLLAIVFGV